MASHSEGFGHAFHNGERGLIRIGAFSPTSGQPAGARISLWYYNVSTQQPREKYKDYLLENKARRSELRLIVTIVADPPLDSPIMWEVELKPEGVRLLPNRAVRSDVLLSSPLEGGRLLELTPEGRGWRLAVTQLDGQARKRG